MLLIEPFRNFRIILMRTPATNQGVEMSHIVLHIYICMDCCCCLPTAKDFIRNMMEKNPTKRFLTEQALTHPWWVSLLSPSDQNLNHTHLLPPSLTHTMLCPQDCREYSERREHFSVCLWTDGEKLCPIQMEGERQDFRGLSIFSLHFPLLVYTKTLSIAIYLDYYIVNEFRVWLQVKLTFPTASLQCSRSGPPHEEAALVPKWTLLTRQGSALSSDLSVWPSTSRTRLPWGTRSGSQRQSSPRHRLLGFRFR